jgi:hypothetical protein
MRWSRLRGGRANCGEWLVPLIHRGRRVYVAAPAGSATRTRLSSLNLALALCLPLLGALLAATHRRADDQFATEDVSATFNTVEVPTQGLASVRVIHAGRIEYTAPPHAWLWAALGPSDAVWNRCALGFLR